MSARSAYSLLSLFLLCSLAGWPVRAAANILLKVAMGITACWTSTLVSNSSRGLHAR
jgi:hypothetical protein